MLKRIAFLVVAVFLFGALAYAASPAVEGTVQKIDRNSITIQVGSDQKTFTFDRDVKFTMNGKVPNALTVKPGDKASVVANKKNVAEKIDITPQASAASNAAN